MGLACRRRRYELRVAGVKSHLGENGCAIVGNSDIAVGRDQNLIQATRTLEASMRMAQAIDSAEPYQRGFDNVGHCLGSNNVRFDCLGTVLSLLFSLTVEVNPACQSLSSAFLKKL